MENVFDIIEEKKLIRIIPQETNMFEKNEVNLDKVAIAVNLYYKDTVQHYFKYLEQVPSAIDIYIISSNSWLNDEINSFVSCGNNRHFLMKENRGRDVSALLVTFRDIAKKYEYFCFLHDKRAHDEYMTDDVNYWIDNMWENMLASQKVICNILGMLERQNIGFVTPPGPIGRYSDAFYVNSWFGNFENTKRLASEFGLKCDLDPQKPPITLGTVFWCKAKAIRKILEKQWKYEDFPEEPMPNDGTINHAIERIFAYVAQDAGYDTAVVMCNSYAEWLVLYMQRKMMDSFSTLWDDYRIRNANELKNSKKVKEDIAGIFETCEKVYLYGAGFYGKLYLEKLKAWGYEPCGFVISNKNTVKSEASMGYPVYKLEELEGDKTIGFILTADYKIQNEMENALKKYGFKHYLKLTVR